MKSIRTGHCWVYELFEHAQNIRTNLLKLHGQEEHCSNWLSLPEWPRMTRNDHSNKLELSIRPHSGVDSAQWDWGISTKHSTFITTPSIIHDQDFVFKKTVCKKNAICSKIISQSKDFFWLIQAPNISKHISRNGGATFKASRKTAHNKMFLYFGAKRQAPWKKL